MFVYLIVYNLFTLCISCIDKIKIKVFLLSKCAKHFLLFTLTCRNIFFLFTLTCRDAPKLYEPPFTCIYAITYCVGHESLAGSLPDETDRPMRRRFSLDIKIPCLARAGTLYGLRCVGVWYGAVSRERRPHPDSVQHNLAKG